MRSLDSVTLKNAESPKTRLIRAAADLIYRQGWNGTGINQILAHADVPKGSFYYYFDSKEDLGVAIVEHRNEALRTIYGSTLLNESLCGRLALEAFFDEQVRFQRDSSWKFGCPVGNLSSEVAASVTDVKIAKACRRAMDELVDALEAAIKRGQGDGSLRTESDARTMALLAASLWHGGLLFTKTFQAEKPASVAIQGIADVLFAGRAARA